MGIIRDTARTAVTVPSLPRTTAHRITALRAPPDMETTPENRIINHSCPAVKQAVRIMILAPGVTPTARTLVPAPPVT